MKKMASFVLFPFLVLELIPEQCIFANLCYLSKTSKSIKVIYLNSSERPHHVLSENSMFYRGLSNSSRDIEE